MQESNSDLYRGGEGMHDAKGLTGGKTFERQGDFLKVFPVSSIDARILRSDWSLGGEPTILPDDWKFSDSSAAVSPAKVRIGSICFKTLLFRQGVSYEERLSVADKGSLVPLDMRYLEFFYRNQHLIPRKIKGNILFPGIDIVGPQGHRSIPCLTREKEWWVKGAVCIDRGHISDDDAFALVRCAKQVSYP